MGQIVKHLHLDNAIFEKIKNNIKNILTNQMPVGNFYFSVHIGKYGNNV